MIVKIAVGCLATILGLFSACTVAVLNAGVGSVSVKNEEISLWLPLPMALAEVGVWFVPTEDLANVRGKLAPVKGLVFAGMAELQGSPDVILVEVDTPEETVLIQKEGSDLIVDVDSRSEGEVHLELPIRSLERILRSLAG
jgi:hypothetical protein